MKAMDRLQDARAAIQGREYQRALDQLVWFHNHALDEDIALRGVRLSFALADWIELGSMYPKALQVLRSIRNDKTSTLLSGKGSRQAFIDVSAINEYLKDEAATYGLFVQIKGGNADLAHACSQLALPSIVNAGDFALAKEIYGNPDAVISSLADSLNEDIDWSRSRSDKRRDATLNAIVRNFVGDVCMLLTTFEATDGNHRRQSLARQVVEKIHDEDCRAQVASGIGV